MYHSLSKYMINLSIIYHNHHHLANMELGHLRGDADKSLARPGRKQATATKLGIYSTSTPTKLNTLLSPLL